MADFPLKQEAQEVQDILDGAFLSNQNQSYSEETKAFMRAKIGASATGEGIKILSHFDTLEELEASITKPKGGDAYSVGTELPYNLYIFDFLNGAWRNYGPIRANDIKARFAQNAVVPISAWKHDPNVFPDYPYKAAIALPELTGNDFPIVAFSPTDASSGYFSPVAYAFDSYVEIWARAIPSTEITIPAMTFIIQDVADTVTGNSTKGITNASGGFPTGGLGTDSIADGAITHDKLAADVKTLAFTDVAVPDSAWMENSTLALYPYSAKVDLPGVGDYHFVDVVFDENNSDLANIAESVANGVKVFAAAYPEEIIKIKTLLCTPTKVSEHESAVYGIIAVTYAAGATCTCTDGTTTLTAKTTSGKWQFAVPNAGAWVITDGTNSQTVNIVTQGQAVSVNLTESVETEVIWYEIGDQHTDITGGWAKTGYSFTDTSASYTINGPTFSDSGMKLSVTADTQTAISGTQNAIDLTDVEAINVDVSAFSGESVYLCVNNTKAVWDSGMKALKQITKTGTINVPTTSLSGSFYIAVVVFGTDAQQAQNITVSKISPA